MKTKSLLIATGMTMALFGSAYADTTTIINITGSTAGRSTVHTALSSATGPLAQFNKGTNNTAAAPSYVWYKVDGSVAAASSQDGAIYKAVTGTTPNQDTVYVRTFWAGSASGVDYVSNQTQLDRKFLVTTVTFNNLQLAGTAVALNASLSPASTTTVSTFGFSDVKQSATPHQSSPLAEQTDMFILPFRWVKTNGGDLGPVTNITSQQARALFTTIGVQPMSLLTGVATDTFDVYAVGRDSDSGTRITAMAETGAGVFTPLDQYQFTVDNNGSAANLNDDTINTPVELGNNGYASGGSVANVLGATGFNCIGYLGSSDANKAITQGALGLTYNGSTFSVANVENGSYTFWSKYQAIRKQTLSGTASSLFGSLKTTLINLATDTASGTTVKISDMLVDRVADGGDVLPK
ncbi:MAG: hypothetical protein ABI600_14705 [Luteolibacter sp.]